MVSARPPRLPSLLVLVLSLFLAAGAARQAPVYRDARLPTDARVRDLVARMSLEEKFWQLFMIPGDLDDPSQDYSHGVFGLQVSMKEGGARAHAERINAIQKYFVEHTRLGIPIIVFDEAVHGLARNGSTMFPQAISLAATWDPDLVARVAAAIARETRSRGIRQVLSPVVNIADDVRWGRVEETYGEDPLLASVMARAFVGEFERAGIVATPKHFVANVGEGGRDSYPIQYSERLLAERYYPPFRAALDAGARSVMTAYNSVDGLPATQNGTLLNRTLKHAWGFRGFVISDAAATGGATVLHMTEPDTPSAAQHAWDAGLDVVFQSSYPQFRPYWEAVRRGLVAESVIDAAVTRVLRVKFDLGLFEHPYVDAAAAGELNGRPEHLQLARDAAAEGVVLLKNDRHTLPLQALRSLAVIGVDAREVRLGGYSADGVQPVSILDALRRRVGGRTDVRYAPGPGRTVREFVPVPKEHLALKGEYFDNITLTGEPRLVRTDPAIDFGWTLNAPGPGIPLDWYSVRWTGTITAPSSGVSRLGVEGNDGYRLFIDGALAIDNWRKQSYGLRFAGVRFAAGSAHDVRLEFFESTGNARIKLIWDGDVRDESAARIDEAVALARQCDAAVIVAGLEEGEFRDRAYLRLPGRQEELVRAVAATGKPVTVVVIGGSAVTMSPWIDSVGAVLDAWYPGERGGEAIAAVLSGDQNPAGRLPISFPMTEGQLPLSYDHKPTGRGDDYVDSSGKPAFPFGFGLSYSSFDYSNLRLSPDTVAPGDRVRVRCTVRNTGSRKGDEVVQLYLRDEVASVARPVMQLAAFRRVPLEAGEAQDVSFEIGAESLGLLDRDLRWVVEPGAFRVMVGASSADIRLRGRFMVR